MSGRVLGTIAGAAVAFFLPGSYVALGAVIGGAIGATFDPNKKVEGPRLDDLKAQESSYGVGIPIMYGTERISPNVVWSTNKREVSTTETQGKGGGGGIETTTYSYFVDMRLMLCETPRNGATVRVIKIFQDGKLIYDVSAGQSAGAVLASGESTLDYTLYQGDEAQLPDPTEEAYQGGPGSSPAYRGVVSIVVRNVETPFGRTPQFSFVLTVSATSAVEKIQLFQAGGTGYAAMMPSADEVWQVEKNGGVSNALVNITFGSSNGAQPMGAIDLGPTFANINRPVPIAGHTSPWFFVARTYVDPTSSTGFNANVVRLNARTLEVAQFIDGDYAATAVTGPGVQTGSRAAYDPQTGLYALTDVANGRVYVSSLGGAYVAATLSNPTTDWAPIGLYQNTLFYLERSGPTNMAIVGLRLDTSAEIFRVAAPANPDGATYLASDISRSMLRITACSPLAPSFSGYVWLATSTTTARIYRVDQTGWTQICSDAECLVFAKSGITQTEWFINDNVAVIGPALEANRTYTVISLNAVSTVGVKAKDVIADQCERAGETRYSVAELSDADTLAGYKIANPASARANIDPVMTGFQYFSVDEDGIIKFRPYSAITSVATVTFDELGQTDSDLADAFALNRIQEIDLPRTVTVNYIEPTFDFNKASESYERQVTSATEEASVELPLAISADRAQKTAQCLANTRWRAQNQRSAKVSRKFAHVSPGDGVTIEYPRRTLGLWRVTSVNDSGALIEWNVEPGDAALWTQAGLGASDYAGQAVDPLATPTNMLPLDSPIFRDVDDNAGVYVAAEGYSAVGWNGYTLFIGDDDANLQDRGTSTTPVPLGVAESALGDWVPNMFDGVNSVIVNMGGDTLSSTTFDNLFTSRTNLALIGLDGRWEAIQFQNAASLGGGRYLLSGFLRGLFGTERFRNTHQPSDRFVILQVAGMLRPTQDVGSIGATKSYRAISLGRGINSQDSIRFTSHGIALLPYSPWDLRKSVNASNDQQLTWERRSRLSTNALRGSIPLGEAVEAYAIEFYNSGFYPLVGTLTSSTRYVTLTAAQQANWGLIPGGLLYVRVYQLSDAVGRGAPLQATL